MTFALRVSLAAAALFAAVAAFGADLEMTASQTIEGFMPQQGTFPVSVTLTNDGPDARGAVQVFSSSFTTEYPVELPQGSKKVLFTYPSAGWGEIRFVLQTDRGRVIDVLQPTSNWEQGRQVLLLVTDTPGEMAFLRARNQDYSNVLSIQDAYLKPGKAPDRPVGYAGVGAVLLGAGSERLEDREVEALKLWTLTGGTIVFMGGASAPILNDPRWQNALPAKNFRTVNLANSAGLKEMGKRDAPECTITTGTALAVANARMEGGMLISAERAFGAGRVVYISFNPFEAPLNRWEGRSSALKAAIRPAELQTRRAFISQFAADTAEDLYAYTTAGSTGMAATAGTTAAMPGAYGYPASPASDPFSTKLPPSGQIFMLLGIYFLCVVPLNFFVLKKLNRAELAWFTAPVLSLIFAGVLFSRAQGLYASALSTASQGIVVAMEGEPTGMFIGSSQVFIPRGGNYDLQLSDVDSVGIVDQSDPYGGYSPRGRENNTLELDPVDDGQIHVPRLRANNLAFREITYRQRIPTGNWFSVRRVDGGNSVEVTNKSPFALHEGKVYIGKKYVSIGKKVEAGGRIVVRTKGKELDSMAELGRNMSSILTSRSLAVVGKLQGFRPGPQLGREVEAKTNITVAFFAKDAA